jgi:predicted metal-dependent phosphoesterase TrpH
MSGPLFENVRSSGQLSEPLGVWALAAVSNIQVTAIADHDFLS